MLENLLSYFFPAAILIMLISASFYFIEKNKIITQYKQGNSEHLKISVDLLFPIVDS